MPVIARLAPTPSGYLHLGNAANLALNALLAGADGELLLRIDDLDRARFRPEYLADVFRLLDWLELRPTLGPRDPADFHAHWRQELRMPQYLDALEHLRGHSAVFACPCSRSDLAGGQHRYGCPTAGIDLDAAGVSWRVATEGFTDGIYLPDLVAPAGFRVAVHAAAPDFVIRKKDGTPSYQLACTVDDVLFGVTHVGRGQDLLPSSAAQAILSDLLGYAPLVERITFVHHPLLLAGDGEKLSKSAGAQSAPGLGEGIGREEVFALARGWLVG